MTREFFAGEGRASEKRRLFTHAFTLSLVSATILTLIAGMSVAGDAQAKTIEFEGKTWAAGLAKEVTVADYKGKKAMHVLGGEQSYVYLPDVEFQDGIIEVDIAGPIFSGIGFRGRESGKRLEKVYFRPQNAGTAKHANTVQYAVIGREDGTWRYLRTNFPGKYETGADIKKDEWFHVKLVIRGAEVKVYVDEKPEPVLCWMASARAPLACGAGTPTLPIFVSRLRLPAAHHRPWRRTGRSGGGPIVTAK